MVRIDLEFRQNNISKENEYNNGEKLQSCRVKNSSFINFITPIHISNTHKNRDLYSVHNYKYGKHILRLHHRLKKTKIMQKASVLHRRMF